MRYALVGLALFLVGCGGGQETETPAADEGVMVDGLPVEVYDCLVERWDTIVGEWNDLTVQRDDSGASEVVVDGVEFLDYDAWAAHHGHPLEWDEVRNDSTAIAECGG